MKTTGRLNSYLVDIDQQAEQCLHSWCSRWQNKKKGITEGLKTDDPMKWVRKMNSIKSRATEIVNADLIDNYIYPFVETVTTDGILIMLMYVLLD